MLQRRSSFLGSEPDIERCPEEHRESLSVVRLPLCFPCRINKRLYFHVIVKKFCYLNKIRAAFWPAFPSFQNSRKHPRWNERWTGYQRRIELNWTELYELYRTQKNCWMGVIAQKEYWRRWIGAMIAIGDWAMRWCEGGALGNEIENIPGGNWGIRKMRVFFSFA